MFYGSDAESSDDFQPISALNDLLFCERRCAMHRNEQIWVENRYTIEGSSAHQKVHGEPTSEELGGGGRLVRAVRLRSERLRLVGIADLVEFRSGPDGETPFPVEYKRGRRRRWDNDDVQLCAQALCLEEMLSVAVPAGAVFHLKSRRRREIPFDRKLRASTEAAALRLHELLAAGITPSPIPKPRCQGCSLLEMCMPYALSRPRAAAQYVRALYFLSDGLSDGAAK